MTKPTPSQGRVLKELLAWGDKPALGLHSKRDEPSRIGGAYSNLLAEQPTIVTLKILFDNGWIEPRTPQSWYDFGSSLFQVSPAGLEALSSMTDDDFVAQQAELPIFTAAQIVEALKAKYDHYNRDEYRLNVAPQWIYFDEVQDKTGGANSRIDFWVLNCWRSNNFKATAYEIKVYRSDLLKELATPEKRQFAMSVSDYYFFVTPPDLMAKDEVPEDCGLMELHPDGRLRIIVEAPYIEKTSPNWAFIAALGRRLFGVIREVETK